MKVTLRPVTKDNWLACIDLCVQPEQEGFVAPNLYSLAQARVYPECIPLAIYAGETPVGFVLYGFAKDGTPSLYRLMIDQQHQRRGYGRAALQELLLLIEAQSERDSIMLSVVPENHVALTLYQSMGFVDTGEIVDGEKIMRLRLV